MEEPKLNSAFRSPDKLDNTIQIKPNKVSFFKKMKFWLLRRVTATPKITIEDSYVLVKYDEYNKKVIFIDFLLKNLSFLEEYPKDLPFVIPYKSDDSYGLICKEQWTDYSIKKY